jgi:hypothetical protein
VAGVGVAAGLFGSDPGVSDAGTVSVVDAGGGWVVAGAASVGAASVTAGSASVNTAGSGDSVSSGGRFRTILRSESDNRGGSDRTGGAPTLAVVSAEPSVRGVSHTFRIPSGSVSDA